VDWCQKNIPGADFHLNQKEPPLDFAEDKSIDLVFACSVFTHISLDLQRLWLQELHRILRPGGIFLCTVLGQSYVENMLDADDLGRFKRDGFFQMLPDHDRVSLSSRHTGQDDIFQTRDHIFKSFGSVFTILDYLERGVRLQNLLVLTRPER
jgi:predicted SAM-dependent methyltransferase